MSKRHLIVAVDDSVAVPRKDLSVADHAEAMQFRGAQSTHAGGAMDDCSLDQSVDDLALPNRRLAVKLAVDQHDRRVSIEEPTIDVAAARRGTKFGSDQRCSLGPLQA